MSFGPEVVTNQPLEQSVAPDFTLKTVRNMTTFDITPMP
jgi:hypothetical protein